jgi:3'(2'), 5'-bisphosphate nucleotidase
MVEKVTTVCREAGNEILRFYGLGAPVTYKDDRSPLTAADQASHEFLVKALSKLTPSIPIVSEESFEETVVQPGKAGRYWLVDPLDGTKEF